MQRAKRLKSGDRRSREAARKPSPLPKIGDPGRPAPRTALLLNPFRPKDPNGSFAKDLLTPTLALTRIGAATPEGWKLSYWDENLLRGPPPTNPLPQVVGIVVNLTSAPRAYEIAHWYRRLGALVVLSGPHVTSRFDEVRHQADVIAIGDGLELWPLILDDFVHGRVQPYYR